MLYDVKNKLHLRKDNAFGAWRRRREEMIILNIKDVKDKAYY